MIIHELTRQGLSHDLAGTSCQDSTVCFSKRVDGKDIVAIALADGAGSYSRCQEGGQWMAWRAAALMANEYNRFKAMDDRAVIRKFISLIACTLQQLHRQFPGENEEAFASTLLVCGFIPSTGEYLALQLGDGAIIIEDGSGVHRPMLPFEDGSHSYLTTSSQEEQRRQMLVYRGKAERVMLTSDGAADFLYDEGGGASPWSKWVFDCAHAYNGHRFKAMMNRFLDEEYVPVDDFSLILLERGVPSQLPMPEAPMNHHYPKRQKAARAYHRYSLARESGLPPRKAARRAGWGVRNRDEKRRKACELMLWPAQ